MNNTKKTILATSIVAFSILTFASPADAAWKQQLGHLASQTISIVKTILGDVTITQQGNTYEAKIDETTTVGMVSVGDLGTGDTTLLPMFQDEVKAAAKTEYEIKEYMKKHQHDKDQNKVQKEIQAIIEKNNTNGSTNAPGVQGSTGISTGGIHSLSGIDGITSFRK